MATVARAPADIETYRALARQLRADSIRCSTAAGSGHPTSSLSAADLVAVLLAGHLRYDFGRPDDPANDRFVLSKGHASPLLYAAFRAAGAIDDAELLSFRKLGSRVEGHPAPVLPWVDVATGSLGQGFPIAVGMAWGARRVLDSPIRVWALLGDSETAEGSVWEAFDRGGHERLSNLTAILDVNRLGQRGPTQLQWDTDAYAQRIEAFGWEVLVVDGHDLERIDEAYSRAAESDRPTAVVARTRKGRGVSFIEDQDGWHGKTLKPDEAQRALEELGNEPSRTFEIAAPPAWTPKPWPAPAAPRLPSYQDPVATRKAYGEALAALGHARGDVVALDAEVSNSTHAEDFKKEHPERFFECYIAEQQMVAAAVGMQAIGLLPFASTFAAFLSRAYDFIRMAAISRASIRLSGSHAGVSIGEDGPSQMALEDLAMMRAVHSSTVLYPCDAGQAAKLVAAMADLEGISYIRTTREKTPIIYDAAEEFAVGGSKVVRGGGVDDRVAIVAAGITVHEAIKAADELEAEGIAVRVIDAYSVKPMDRAALVDAARVTGGRVIVVEDHWAWGGIGDAVLAELAAAGTAVPHYRHLAVREMPGSGKPAELLDAAGISARHIAAAARELAPS